MKGSTFQRTATWALAGAMLVPVAASATNGYFNHGWGTRSKAMAGAAAALPQDALVSATNPAGMAFVGTRSDLGIELFMPSPRGYRANPDFATQGVPATDGAGNNFTAQMPAGGFVNPGTVESDGDLFVVPSLAFNYELNESSTLGLSIYANGGMNTDYPTTTWANFAPAPNQMVMNGQPVFATVPPGTPFEQGGRLLIQNGQPVPVTVAPNDPRNGNPNGVLTARGSTGVSLEQLFISVPYTYKFGDGRQALGIAPVFAVQSFEAKGLQPFRAASAMPDKVTNNGKDWSYGLGLQVGWYGEVTGQLAFGLSYRSKVFMTEFDDYKGLFADGGSFDIPATLNFGVAYKARPDLTVAFDYQRIFYDEIPAIANSNDLDLSPCFGALPKPSFCLGNSSGLGFGWKGMDVYKLGLRWQQSDKLALYGGVSYNSELLKHSRQSLFNVLTPATVRWHLSLGASYEITPKDAINLAFTYMPEGTIDGTSPSITGLQTGSLFMEQMDLELSWSHRF